MMRNPYGVSQSPGRLSCAGQRHEVHHEADLSRCAGGRVQRVLSALIAWCGILVVTTIASAGAGSNGSSATLTLPYKVVTAHAKPEFELIVLDLVNRERLEKELPAFVPHAGLRAAARAHAQEMFAHGFISHRSLDGRTLAQRIAGRNVRDQLIGENLAYTADVQAAHARFMVSAGHRQNILSPHFSRIGIAVLDGGAHGLVVVQDFSGTLLMPQGTGSPRGQN
jgi:uncharacterized protein YkwD